MWRAETEVAQLATLGSHLQAIPQAQEPFGASAPPPRDCSQLGQRGRSLGCCECVLTECMRLLDLTTEIAANPL